MARSGPYGRAGRQGNMGNRSALGKGFEEMLQMGLIERLPKLSVIQAEGSVPLRAIVHPSQGGIQNGSRPDS